MVFSKDQYDTFIGGDQRSAIQGSQYRWTNNELPYMFDGSLTSEDQEIVRSAVATFNNEFNGCVAIMYLLFNFVLKLLKSHCTFNGN